MYLVDNPVLQRELLVNLRTPRAFVLMLVYQTALAAVVYFAWPQTDRLDLSTQPEAARRLVNMFFLGQYVLASLMAPSFAAGAISGEKERKTYEMLLASPLRPGAIVSGKMIASLTHLVVLIFSSLPIVMLCLPLGGVSLYEVLAAYLGLVVSVTTFAAVAIACSSFFQRTAASLAVSYLAILPLALLAIVLWVVTAPWGGMRLLMTVTLVPGLAMAICIVLFSQTAARLLHPPDVGSEGKEVVDLDEEAEEVIGLVIQRHQFPDKLFAPAKRTDLLPDGRNPVFDKEIRSEIFSQGTLMLRVVIQVSMALAILLMAFYLYIWPQYAAWYIAYVVLFNTLVGPVFNAGSVTSERERQTLDLLLTTTIAPWQILWGKLLAGLRVSSVLTLFLLWPVLLACVMVPSYWPNLLSVAAYVAIVLVTASSTATLALFCSVIARRTTIALLTTYAILIILFCGPIALESFIDTFYEGEAVAFVDSVSIASPFSATFAVPLEMDDLRILERIEAEPTGRWSTVGGFFAFWLGLDAALMVVMTWLFRKRWRVSVSADSRA